MEPKKLNASETVYRVIEQKIFNQELTPRMKIMSENNKIK